MEIKEIKKEKITFLKRLKTAIFNLEDYGMFLGERLTVAFKYFFLLMLVMTLIISAVETYNFLRQVNKAYSYVENELPDFKYSDGIVEFNTKVEAYDEDYKFRLFINTDENVEESIVREYKDKIYDSSYGVIALKDKLICISDDMEIEELYSDLSKEYNFNISNKADLVSKINSISPNTIGVIYFISSSILLYIVNVLTVLSDICLVAVFGWVASRICGVAFKMTPMIALAIYSLSLSIVLKIIYYCVLSLTGFVVQYFDIIYLLIAYVYMIAAIFMVKYDLIKQTQELQKIIEVQKKVHEESEENDNTDEKDKEKDKNNDDKNNNEKKDDGKSDENEPGIENNNEPDGSEI